MSTHNAASSGKLFAVFFPVCATSATVLVSYCPDSLINWCVNLTIIMTKAMCLSMGVAATSSADIILVNGFAMRIIAQCTALHYVIIIAAAILLYPRHSLQYRLAGLIASVGVVVALNSIRLVVTGIIGSVSWDAFVIMHDYLWVAAFSLLVLALWIIWAERLFVLTGNKAWRGVRLVLYCSAAYGALYLAMPFYGSLMAYAASLPFKILLHDFSVAVSFTGERMLYTYPGGTFTANFTSDLMIAALYIGFILSSGIFEKAAIRMAVSGLAVIFVLSVAIISGCGVLTVISGRSNAVLFLWCAHGLLLQSVLLWWKLRNKWRLECLHV